MILHIAEYELINSWDISTFDFLFKSKLHKIINFSELLIQAFSLFNRHFSFHMAPKVNICGKSSESDFILITYSIVAWANKFLFVICLNSLKKSTIFEHVLL